VHGINSFSLFVGSKFCMQTGLISLCLEKCRVNPLGWGIAKIRGLGQSDSQSRSWFWESPLQMSITHSKAQRKGYHEPKATSDEGPGSNVLRTNLDWFEANSILELDYTLVLSLILGSPNHELSFLHWFCVQTNWFSLQNRCHISLASICHFLVLNISLKALGPIWSFQPIRLLELIGPWFLDPHLKSP
jgi:hypothetical protein